MSEITSEPAQGDLFTFRKEVVKALSGYIPPMSAQYFVDGYCRRFHPENDRLDADDLYKFVLHLAKERDNFSDLTDRQFSGLLNSIVHLIKMADKNQYKISVKEGSCNDN